MNTPSPKKTLVRPPLYTLLTETVGWTLDRTADIPKSQRFTFGQRLDNLAGTMGEMRGGHSLPRQSQEASLTAAPVPAGITGKDAAQAVAGNSVDAGRTSRPAVFSESKPPRHSPPCNE